MANEWVTDHKWRDIKSQDLPDWVKRRIRELNRRSLIGKSFEYRREPTTGRYQRKLRRHPPRVVVWTKHTVVWGKRNLGKAFTISITARKLFLSLLVIISLVLAVQTGYLVFTHQAAAVKGTIIFLAELGVLFWLISILRSYRYRRRKPSFKSVFFALVGIALVCAFTGIEPLASYKDWAASFVGQSWEAYQEEKVQREAQTLIGLEHEVLVLVNSERSSRDIAPLLWDDKLHGIAREHSEEMARRGELFHSSVDEPYAENCWGGGAGSLYHNTASDIVSGWMGSPKHRTWLLCPHIKHIGAGIAVSDEGMYASWTFWKSETSYSDWWYSDDSSSPPDWWY